MYFGESHSPPQAARQPLWNSSVFAHHLHIFLHKSKPRTPFFYIFLPISVKNMASERSKMVIRVELEMEIVQIPQQRNRSAAGAMSGVHDGPGTSARRRGLARFSSINSA